MENNNRITPKFCIGDRIQTNDCIQRKTIYTVTNIKDEIYNLSFIKNGKLYHTAIEVNYQHEFELSDDDPKKFNPFDKIIVRKSNKDIWTIDMFSYKNDDGTITGLSGIWQQYILYSDNYKSLIGTDKIIPDNEILINF